MHVHLYVNGSSLMLSDFYPEHGHAVATPQADRRFTSARADIDARVEGAVDVATVEMPLQVMFWGDRWGSMRDPFGVFWAMNAPVERLECLGGSGRFRQG